MYMPCGTMQTAGASYNWLKNTLCQLEQQAAQNLDLSVYELMNLSVEESKPGANNLLYLPLDKMVGDQHNRVPFKSETDAVNSGASTKSSKAQNNNTSNSNSKPRANIRELLRNRELR